jgi:phosphoglycolate phosphatase
VPAPVIGFDLDMTLVDSAAGIIASVQHVCAEFGVEADADEIGSTIGLPLDRVFPRWLPDHPYGTLLAAYREHYAVHGVPLTVALPGARDVLDAVRERGSRIIVVTAKHGPIAERVLEVAGLSVDVVVGESFAEQKAQVLHDHAALAYVGDHPGDMRAAQLAQARAIGVTTGPTPAEALQEAGADIVLRDLTGRAAQLIADQSKRLTP